MRLDDIDHSRQRWQSANEALRECRGAGSFDQAERQVQRQKTLQAQGMTSVQALDDAEGPPQQRRRANLLRRARRGSSALSSRLLGRTEVRAPFDGVVSERKASVGDTAQVGKELVKVIDAFDSMRFEGMVSADRMHEIKVGQKRVVQRQWLPRCTEFAGRVKRRIDAAADATTRQVEADRRLRRWRPRRRGWQAFTPKDASTSGSAAALMAWPRSARFGAEGET